RAAWNGMLRFLVVVAAANRDGSRSGGSIKMRPGSQRADGRARPGMACYAFSWLWLLRTGTVRGPVAVSRCVPTRSALVAARGLEWHVALSRGCGCCEPGRFAVRWQYQDASRLAARWWPRAAWNGMLRFLVVVAAANRDGSRSGGSIKMRPGSQRAGG